ncbi:hypothetical protein J6590_032464, partial [Homalodisca vitripennis]
MKLIRENKNNVKVNKTPRRYKRAPHVRRERVGTEPSSTDKSRKFLTNSVHAANSDLSSER